MRVAGEAIARQAGIENGDLAAGTAELQGGAIGVESVQGQGIRFWFTLPAVSPERLSPVREETYRLPDRAP